MIMTYQAVSLSTLIRHSFLTSFLENAHLTKRGTKNVPIKGADEKRQITATFDVSATGKFLFM